MATPPIAAGAGHAGTPLKRLLRLPERAWRHVRRLARRHYLSAVQYDYVAPGLSLPGLDRYFPDMRLLDRETTRWPHVRRNTSHRVYGDRRHPNVGFINKDETAILYASASLFSGRRGLEIGTWRGWSAAHILHAGVVLDVVDPVLADAAWRSEYEGVLAKVGVSDRATLHPHPSPERIWALGAENRRWSFVFIDGAHDGDGPRNDALAVMPVLKQRAMVLFHDLYAPDVAAGLAVFSDAGWMTMIYQTGQIMGVAWRGDVAPVEHVPDPRQNWSLPEHLAGYRVSGLDVPRAA